MDIYHSTYTQYIDLMTQLKGDVAMLANQSHSETQKATGANTVLSQIDDTIDTASRETFLPSGELLNITKGLISYKSRIREKNPATEATFKQCFRTLNKAAISLRQITDDCALSEANELSIQEMY